DGTLSLETTCKATSNWTTSPWNQICPPDVIISGSDKFGDAYSMNEDPSNHMIYSVTLSGYLLGFTQTGSGSNFSATMLPQIDIGLGYLRANGSYIGIRRSVIDPNSRTLWIPIDQVYNPQTCPTWPGSTPCTPIVLDQWLYKFDLATLYSNLTPTPTPTFTPTPTATPAPTLTPTPNPPTATSSGLLGNYFSNRNLSGTPTFTRTDATVNFNWGTASPAPSLSNINYSIRWTGFVTPSYSQTYTFYTKTDDGTRLYVNNTLLINDWANQAATQKSGTISLLAGHTYPIKMEYYQHLGKASAQLSWSSASQLKQIIPQSQLYH
ncbi:MAG TPA: PA14 domain-containing protein, partial [Patescibacteria group bacterium]